MTKRFGNFAEFVADMHVEFSRSANERLVNFINLASSLNQGCGCTRRARAESASREYRSVGEYLTEDNVNFLKNKWPGHRIEFAEGKEVFFVIEA
mgnify:CR=1 FL=1